MAVIVRIGFREKGDALRYIEARTGPENICSYQTAPENDQDNQSDRSARPRYKVQALLSSFRTRACKAHVRAFGVSQGAASVLVDEARELHDVEI
jgi:hypothetical protein